MSGKEIAQTAPHHSTFGLEHSAASTHGHGFVKILAETVGALAPIAVIAGVGYIALRALGKKPKK